MGESAQLARGRIPIGFSSRLRFQSPQNLSLEFQGHVNQGKGNEGSDVATLRSQEMREHLEPTTKT
jgi:hypothetical protein